MQSEQNQIEEILNEKMKQFNILINHGKLAFNQHQYDGVKFCINRELTPLLGIRGGFIADEMGLGKTITTIATIFANYVGNTVIILPPALLTQWAQEIKRTTGHTAIVYHGAAKKKITKQMLEKAPIVLATYNGIQYSEMPNLLHQTQWARIVFDEAHHLRNKTLILEGALQLKSHIKWFISGTPIQNKIRDFSNLCHVAGISQCNYTREELTTIILTKLVLRRTKQEVGIEMPSVTMNHEIVKWQSTNEKELAEEIHSSLHFSHVSADKSHSLSQEFSAKGILIPMIRAKQMCTLPILLKPKIQSLEQQRMIEPGYTLSINKSTNSKLDKVVETLLSRKDNNNGKIIFCQYRSEIDEITRRLKEGGMQNVESIDGRNNKESRKKILTPSKQQNLTKTLILQIQTGCEGLNLQENYSEVYFVTPHWNPSVEDQAIARCHRMGQKKEVQVFRFEMEGFDELDNIEQQLEQRQQEIESEEYTPIIPTLSIDSHIMNIQNTKRDIICKLLNYQQTKTI